MNTGTQWYVGASVAALLIAAACTPDNNTTNPTPPPRFSNCIDKPQTCGGGGVPGFRMTGGGRIDPAVGKTTFGFNVDGRNGPPFKGEMEVVYHGGVAPMTRIHSEEIDSFTGSTDPRGGVCGTWTGTARVSDGSERRYSATACDNGEPGSSPGTGPDRFGITVDGLGSTGVTDLTGGNIQAHK
jgi:hypothetical protein